MENKFKFLTKYSLNKKLKNKWFIVVNIILLLAVCALINIDHIVDFFGGDFKDNTKIIISDNTGYYSEIKSSIEKTNEYLDSKFIIKKSSKSVKKLKNDIKNTKDIIIVLNNDNNNIFSAEIISDSYIDMVKYQTIASSLNSVKNSIALEKSGIDKNKLNQINKEVNIKRTFLNEEKTKDEENSRTILSMASVVLVLPCFMLIVFLVQMIGAEINEEKSTRGMEIIIGNVSPKVHFFSKLASSNIFVLFQAFLLFIYGAIGLLIRKLAFKPKTSIINDTLNSMDLEGLIDTVNKSGLINKLGYVIQLVLILIVLSFLAYSLLAGILASMTTNMENFQQLQTPIMMISLIGYYLIILSSVFPGATFIKVLSVFPLISISLAPSLLLSGEIGVGTIIIAILLLVFVNYLLIKFGLRIYKVGILNYSETDLWKKMFKAVKEK